MIYIFLDCIDWWVRARIYESTLEHQDIPTVYAWLYHYSKACTDLVREDAGPAHVETKIHVYWSSYGDERDTRDGSHGHRIIRDRVTASLGLDHALEPGFSPNEMQIIAYAAKKAALKCLRARYK